LKALTGGELDPTLLHQVFQGLADVTSTVADITASGADQAVAAAAADNGGGVFASLVTLTENAITGLHTVLNGTCAYCYDDAFGKRSSRAVTYCNCYSYCNAASTGAGIENSYGLSIIGFTLFVKALTFPLTYKQLASTTKMQVLQPKASNHK
jgi:60Kd inner membrane protein